MMKKTLASAALALTGLLAVPDKAEAGLEIRIGHGTAIGIGHDHGRDHIFVNGRASCGCPTYVKRIFRGRDHCGRPIFSYLRVPLRCGHGAHATAHRPQGRSYGRDFGKRQYRDQRAGSRSRGGYTPGYQSSQGCR